MNKTVIHIYGPSGAGTTTLGKYISEKLNCCHMDTDYYFWEPIDPPYTVKRAVPERLRLMKKDIESNERLVISGSLCDWGDPLIPYFTLAIRLETDTDIRINRLKIRERAQLGSRIDKGGDMLENHLEFLDWAASYDKGGLEIRSKAKHDDWEKNLSCEILYLDGNDPIEKNLKAVITALNK